MAQNAHNAMVDELPVHPAPDEAEPVDGNDCTYGLEIENLGKGGEPVSGGAVRPGCAVGCGDLPVPWLVC